MTSRLAILLILLLLATAALAVLGTVSTDPLAPYRGPDGSLHIPGGALTPQLQRLIFGGNDLQPFYNVSYVAAAESPYPTAAFVVRGYTVPNPNVFIRPVRQPESLADGLMQLLQRWFPPVDWNAQVRNAATGIFGLFTWNARAVVSVDSTTVSDVTAGTGANTCTTTQTATAADNAVLVMLSEAGTTSFLTVTYGSASLTLITGTNGNGGTVVRTEIWGFVGALPGGAQTMTATLSGAVLDKMTCATILLQGVSPTGSFINGTTNTATSTNATIALTAPVTAGNLSFAVAALQQLTGPGGAQPTAVTGTNATATDLYGVAVGHCTGIPTTNECAAGADIPNPGTAVTWTNASTTWAASAVEVVAGGCGANGVICTSVTVTNLTTAANACTTSQTTIAGDNAVLVMLSEAGTTAFIAVTYGTTSLSLITGTSGNGGTAVRTEIWGFAGALPTGTQTMTATLSGAATAKMTCATVLLQGVQTAGSFINGKTNTATSANATITFTAAVATGDLAVSVAALQQVSGVAGAQPTAVTGTGATARDLYGVTVGYCTGNPSTNECAAGANIPTGGTAITWVNPSTTWVVSTVEVVSSACGSGNSNCYRIGTGGAWNSPTNWSRTSGGAACNCTPAATDFAIINAAATGTISLAAATTIAGIDMTGFTGTLDTTTTNYNLTVNGNLSVQGALAARGSIVVVSGNVTILGATTAITFGTSMWTVTGTWTNGSTSGAWSAGTGTVTILGAASGTLTFGNLGVNEFNNLTLDSSVAAGVTYTMATNGLRLGGTLLVRNSTAGATGATILDTSAANLTLTAGALSLATFGAVRTQASAVTINGNVTISTANAYVANTGGSWVVMGPWSDASTSASWGFAAAITFRSAGNQTMTFGAQVGNEFAGAVTFDTTAVAGVTYTMATNPLDAGGLLTVTNSAAGATGAVILDTSTLNLVVTAAGLSLLTLGALNSRASAVTLSGGVNVASGNAYVTNTGGAWSVTGAWTDRTTSPSWSFAASVTFRSAVAQSMIFTGSNIAGNEFAGAVTFDTTAVAGVTYTMAAGATGDSSLKIAGSLTVRNTAAGATAATIFDTSLSNFNVTSSSLTVGSPRGGLRSEGSIITVNGAVNVADANSYLVLGSALWTVTGTWTNGSTDTVDWSAGTGTVTFRAAASGTMTFANLGANEANNVVFDTTNAPGVTYTMATNGLRIGGTLTVQNSAPTPTGNTVLSTGVSNLAIISGGVVLGARGTLTANGSTITVNGSWTSTAANHVWNGGTATVIFAATGTLTTSAGDSFNVVTQSAGTTTLGSAVTIAGATTINGILDTSASSFPLTLQATLSIGATGVLNLEASTASTAGNVTIASGGAVRFTGAGAWTINGTWTNANTAVPANWAIATATVRIVDSGAATLTFWTAPSGSEFYNLVLDSSSAAGFTYAQVNPLQTAGTLTIQNSAAGATGAVVFDASATNFASTLGGLSVGTLGAYTSRAATVTVNGTVLVAAGGYITNAATGAWTVAGAWTNGSTSGLWSFLAPITFKSSTNQTMTFKATGTEFGGAVTFDATGAAGVTYTMVTNGLALAGALTIQNSVVGPTGNTVLTTSAANLAITAGSVTIGTNGTLIANASTITVNGNWTATAANATFSAGTSTISFGATGTITMTQAFNNLAVTAGTATLASALTVNGALTVSAGTLAKGTNTMALGSLSLSGGAVTSVSGNVSVVGAVSVSAAASYIAFGSETWTVGGAWTNGSTSASWSVGTATVAFNSASGATISLMAGVPNEFYNVTFNSAASTATFTLATNGLRVANALTVQGGTGTTTLSTSASNLPITASTITVAAGGALTANAATITVRSMDTSPGSFTPGGSTIVVNTSGGTINVPQTVNNFTVGGTVSTTFSSNLTFSGTLTLTSSSPTFSGNLTSSGASTIAFGSATISLAGSWDTSSATSFTATGSTVTFTGAAKTIKLAASQSFAAVSISGTLSQLSQLTATALTLSAGSLTKGTNPLTVNGNLTLSGGALVSTSGAGIVTGSVTISAAASYLQFGSEAWTVSGSWTNASTSASWLAGSGTITFNSNSPQMMTFAGASLAGAEFNNVVFDTTAAAGVAYTMSTRALNLSGNLTIQNTAPTPTGNTSLSTSVGNLGITTTGTIATMATGTLVANGSTITFGSFNTSAGTFTVGTSTLVAGTTGGTINAPQALNNLTVNAGVTLTAASNLVVNGTLTTAGVFATLTFNLTAAGLAALSGGITAGASGTKTIGGSVVVNASGYFVFGAASWTFGGAWTDNSTSASWSAGTATVTFSSATGGTMTFAGGNLAGNEFATVVFASTAATAQTFTMSTRGLVAGAVQVNDAGATTTLDTSATNLAITAATVTLGAGGVLVARGSVITVTSMDSSAGTFTAGTSTVVVSGSAGTVNVPQTLYNLTVNAGITTSFSSTVTWSGTFTLTSSTSTFNASLASIGAATATFGSATISLAGSWDTSSATSFTATGSTVTFTGAAKTVSLAVGQSFAGLTITGTVSQLSQLTATSLTIPTGSLSKGTNPLTVNGNLTLSGGALLSTSGAGIVTGNVSISSATSYVAFGSEAWTVSGSWTNASTSPSWNAGTGTVTFNAGSSQTMTFAGANLPGNEFNAVVFNAGAVAVTFTMSTRALNAGTITVQGGTAVTTLATSNLALTATTLTVAANGALTAGSSVLTVQNMNTSAGTFTPGTSTILVNVSGGTVNVPQTVFNLTVNPGISTTAASALTFSGTLTVTSANVTFNSDLTSSGASAVLSFGGSTLSVGGSWNTTSVASASFTSTSSAVTFTGAGKSVALSAGCSFAALTITGTLSQASALSAASLVVSAGSLSKGTNTLTVNGNLTLSGGAILSTSGSVAVSGNVVISSAASYVAFGSETWTVTGTWSNASTSASWAAGTATVVFTPAGSGTYTFGNLGTNEFNNLQLSPSAAATFTMATSGLRWGGTLTINANATVATAGLPMTGGALTIGNGATLTANASAVNVTNVTITGGTSGTLTLTTGIWNVSGNWDTSGTGATFAPGTSSVTLSGAARTLKLLTGQQFASLTVSGTVNLLSNVTATALTVTGTLTKTGFNLVFNTLIATAGTIADGTVSASNFAVSDNDPTALITLSLFSAWTANTQFAWTHTDTKTTDTITFTISGQTGSAFNVFKNGSLFTSGSVVGGNINFTMLGSDPNVVVNATGCGGNSRYWIQGTGNWSQTSHWASTSGGVGGCSVPGNATSVFFDANSGTGTSTVDVNQSFATLDTTGSSIATIALGTNALTTSGNVTLAAGTLTIGASAGTGLGVGGSLTISGTASLDGGGAASVVSVSGAVTISSATAFMRLGSGTWTVSGAWSNASTSASWSSGTGTIVFNSGTSQTMTFAGSNLTGPEFNNVTFNSGNSATTFTVATRGLRLGNLLTVQGGTAVTTLDLSAANLPLTAGNLTIAANGSLNARGSAITVSGNWDSHLGTFTAATSAVSLTGTTSTINTASPFATLTVSGSYSLASAVTAGATTISGSLNTSAGNFAVSAGSLTITGTLTANASPIAVSGSWDSHLGTFTAGTSTVTMTGAAVTLNTASPYASLHVTGSVILASALTVGTALTIDTNGSLDTSASSYALNAASLTVGSTGTLVGEASTISVTSMDTHLGTFTVGSSTVVVSASGGALNIPQTLNRLTVNASLTTTVVSNLAWSSALTLNNGDVVSVNGNLTSVGTAATLTLNGAALTVSGNWDTSSTSGAYAAGTSTVTLSGAAKTYKAAAGQTLNNAVVSGSVALATDLRAVSLTVTGTLTKTGFNLIFNGLTDTAGTIADGTVNASNFAVANSDPTAFTTISLFSVWSTNVQYGWTHTSSSTTTTITFTLTGVTASVYSVTKNGTAFTSGSVTGGQVQFTMLGSDPAVLVTLSGCTGADEYWILGTGNWSDTAHWATSSGGVGGCPAPLSTINVHIDANSGSGTITLNVDVSIASLNTTGSTVGTVAIGTHALTTSGNVTLAAGTVTVGASTGAGLAVGGALTLSGNAGIDGSATASVVSVVGNTSIASTTAYVRMGTATWTFGGSWSNASTSANWSGGTVLFREAANASLTFGSLPGAEFVNVTFDTTAVAGVVLSMATNPLVWSGTLTVQGTAGTTTLTTGGLGLTGGALVVGNGGVLNAGASAVSVSSVTANGGTSGAIAMTTGAWSVSGNWATTGAGSTLSAGTSTVTFTGAGRSIGLAAGQSFYNVTITGTISLISTLAATATIAVNAGATLTKTGQSIAFNGLTENGTGAITDGSVSVVNFAVTNSDATNVTTISSFSRWILNSEFTWTDSSTVGTSTLTFTIGGNGSGNRFTVTKNAAAFTSGFVNASGQVVFTMLGSDPVVDVIVAAPCGTTRYWTGGAGNWSQTAHWTATSGGPGGCPVPNSTMSVIFDANSGAGMATVDQNSAVAVLNLTGWSGTVALGTFSLAVTGDLTMTGGTITLGASTGSGLTVGGTVALSGASALDGSGAASVLTVTGNMTITSATAFLRMGTGTWAIGGSWSNASTSGNWSVGTGTVIFTSTTSQAMTFGGLGAPEFHNVSFASGAATGAIVFTMASNPLRWGGTLTIQDAAGSTTTLTTVNLSLFGGALTIGNGGILQAGASSVSVAGVAMTGGVSGVLTVTTGTWNVGGSWDTTGAGSVFTKGTGTVILSGAAATVAIRDAADGFYNLTVSGSVTAAGPLDVASTLTVSGTLTTSGNGISGGANLIVSGGGNLVATGSSIAVSSVTMNDAAANTISLTTGTLTVSGSWDTSGPASQLVAGTSTVTLSAATGNLILRSGQAFAALVVSGVYTLGSALSAASLTISSGGLTKGAHALTLTADLTLSGGWLTSVSGNVSVLGNVDISSPSSYIAFGSEAWTVSGSWTNASTSASWKAGTASITFNSSTSRTMVFAALPGNAAEFSSVTFNGGAATVTFTMGGNALRASTVTVLGGAGTTTLNTSTANLALTADTVTVGGGGALQANGSTLTLRAIDTSAGAFAAGTSTVLVNASGGSVRVPQALTNLTVASGVNTTFASNVTWSGTLTLAGATVAVLGNLTASGPAHLDVTSATLTVSNAWDTSSAVAFAAGSSTVAFDGALQTVTMAAGQQFAALTIQGNVILASSLAATSLAVSQPGTLTKSGFGITFNSLTVAGTIVDGTANVTQLTVTNSDTTALVTISGFTEWSAGSKYAWTHTSNESSQTITWTIGGNTAGYDFRVTKDGSDYTHGKVDNSGQVVLTMLGSDPSVEIIVTPPPWWLSPFFLPIPPFALIVVVAMIVQRRRWKPAKAFLVDERGQMVREFTLDKSCEVTYEQALKAGALDAVDKDVRVSKYHARAVHGDMLSLIMLAVGPANIEEVEFARGILVNIQDKFEDRVKARVDEARAEEAKLEEEARQMEEERADLHTRARVFGDMVNAFTIARGKMDTESRSIRSQTQDLVAREQAMVEVRESLEEQAAQLEKTRSSLDETSSDLAQKKEEIADTIASLNEREARLSPKEKKVSTREAALAKMEAGLADREEILSKSQAKLVADLEDYRAKSQEADRVEKELAEERKSLDDLTLQLDEDRKALDARTAGVESREKDVAATRTDLEGKLAELTPREATVAKRESELSARDAGLAEKAKALADEEARLKGLAAQLENRETELANRVRQLEDERKRVDEIARQSAEERASVEAKAASLTNKEADIAKSLEDLEHIKANLGPREAALFGKESDLKERENALAAEKTSLQKQQDLVEAKALEVQQKMDALKDREAALEQDKVVLREARGAFDSDHKEFEDRVAAFGVDVDQRQNALAEREKSLGAAQMKLTQEKEAFDAATAEKSQWIASKEIELEAKEQSLAQREAEIRAQAQEGAKRFSEITAREEALEIEAAKADKVRAELDAKKAELGAMSRDVDARAAKLREEEERKGEELRTWQATLESEQALLKEQKETFEKEMQSLRESWAGRMIRVEQREEELKERESKVQADVEWVARNESELGRREKLAAENLQAAARQQQEVEGSRTELEQRDLELQSRERALQEEASNQSIELEKRADALQAEEAELAGRKAQWETELATMTQKLRGREAELAARQEALETREADAATRELAVTGSQDALRQQEARMRQEQADLEAAQKELESGQLELAQAREKLDTETDRLRTEREAIQQSLAAKEADLRSERERLERESTGLQDKLGSKAKELAAREKDLASREEEQRSKGQDLEARLRDLESQERQVAARTEEAVAREASLGKAEQEQTSRRAAFDAKVQKFETESATRQKEWKDLQTTLKSQEAQLAASTETRHAEIRKRMEDLEQREHSLNALQTQAQMERARLQDQAKAQAARQEEVDAAVARANQRATELKAMDAEILKARQAFESEKANWSSKRIEELKQLEATRDAAAEMTQQSEKLIEESQRRALVAAEAEKTAKRQAEELATAQAALERRRIEAEKAEKSLGAQTTQLRDGSQRMAAKDAELAARAKDLEALQARLAAVEKKGAETAEQLKTRKESLDRESERIAASAALMDKRQAEDESRRAAIEAKLAELAKREQVLSTELQRADHLMEDLNKKEAEIAGREKGIASKDGNLGRREADIARRDAEVMEGMQTLERMNKEHEARVREAEESVRAAAQARKEAGAMQAEAQKLKTQAETMQAEVSKNMRFLQKKALDVLDREEKIRSRENRTDEENRNLETRSQTLQKKEKTLEAERDELASKLEKIKQDNEKLKAKLSEAEKASKSTVDMDEWKRDIENRVKIIQKKALDLLDREEKLRKKEEELKELAAKLGVQTAK